MEGENRREQGAAGKTDKRKQPVWFQVLPYFTCWESPVKSLEPCCLDLMPSSVKWGLGAGCGNPSVSGGDQLHTTETPPATLSGKRKFITRGKVI